MARKKVTPSDKGEKEKQSSSKLNVSSTRKMEILGLSIMSLGVLIAISILSYSETDVTHLSKITLGTIFSGEDGAALRIKNWLGPIGAWLAHSFVFLGFGYGSIILTLVLVLYGWYVFRSKALSNLSFGTVYSLIMMVLFATICGWFIHVNGVQSYSWSGVFGKTIASVFVIALSNIGSALVLFVLTVIALLFAVDRDIQVTIDRLKEYAKDLSFKFAELRERKAEERFVKKQEKELAEKRVTTQTVTTPQVESRKAEPVPTQKPHLQIQEVESAAVNAEPDVEDVYDPEKVLRESMERDRVRLEQKKDLKTDLIGNRASLDKRESKPVEENQVSDLDDWDPEITVYVGENETVARKSDLKKMQTASLDSLPLIKYTFPTIDLLDSPPNEGAEIDMEEINENKRIILDKLKRHNIDIIAIDAIVGPTVTLYELTPAPDVKISKIESYANDLKMALAAMGIRIITPIPGKSAVGIEVPNQTRETVFIKQVINTKKFVESKMHLPIAFGKTIENEVFMVDLAKCPHLLVAGATGSGKSVGINTIITCLLYKCHPDNLKFVLVDPKKIELALYKSLERHFLATLPNMEEPIITDTTKVLEVLNSVCKEMDDRYDLLKLAGVRDLIAYNDKVKREVVSQEDGHRHLPYIVVIIDELADLMMTAGKQIEEPIARIAQLARAVGIHLVVATQRPSVNVITGTIKANFPSRIAYQVASKIDSRTILDTMGADQLVGRGDMLYSGGGPMIRVQNAFVSTEEVERINEFVESQGGYNTPYYLPIIESEEDQDLPSLDRSDRDTLFDDAAKVVVLHQQGSVSLLQRKLRLGYNRAGRLIDQLYAAKIVGPYQGSTARDVLVETEEELDEILRHLD
ncbi:MAG: DNA translocase FtsK [Bacteroidetes bacterium]|nr:DNA translocase FtsK [Bacteroidota bacterium]NCQ11818.1 DNA translocase FtsK [Bacteroidota bacterium]